MLLVTDRPVAAESDLRSRTPDVTVLRADDGARVPTGEAGFDLVCVAGTRLSAQQRSALARMLRPDGRWAQVSDNALSPLRVWDRLTHRRYGHDPRLALRGLRLELRRDAGLESQQEFALLRSSERPVMAFDALSATGMHETLAAGLTHIHSVRGLALRALQRLGPTTAARLAPAWLILAGPPGQRLEPRRIVGKVSTRKSTQVKLLRGDPPRELEKRFGPSIPTAEIAALRELAEVGFPLAPSLLGSGEDSLRYRWSVGTTLRLRRLSDDELVVWIARAAEVLKQMQTATARPDGTVLVHGDFWLGNLLVRDDQVCCVIDWTESRRGTPDVDRRFLLTSLEGKRQTSSALDDELRRVVDDIFR